MIERISPNKNSRQGHVPRIIVVHGDAGKTDEGTLSWITDADAEVSYHVFIGRTGLVYRIVPDDLNAWHAGKSTWLGQAFRKSVNAFSLGVCFANRGPLDKDAKVLVPQETYRPEQYVAGGEVIADWMREYRITLENIMGHSHVSPGRKTDPWPWFDWGRLHTEIRRNL
jgi:N-acetylmuramoyl-L-alanine amidase